MLNLRGGLFAAVSLAAFAAVASPASASTFTTTSPTGGALPSGVTEIGGVVLDLLGLNGVRVVTEVAASSLYVGFANTNPLTFGTQGGFNATVIAALGGGLAGASVRITLYDGDSAPGDFDYFHNTLFVDGAAFGDFSNVVTQETTSDGNTVLSSGTGFGNDILSTGFFSTTDATALANLYAGLGDGSVDFILNDTDPGDNFYDFKQGVDGSLVNVGSGPVVVPPTVPLPACLPMFGAGLLALGAVAFGMKRRQSTAA